MKKMMMTMIMMIITKEVEGTSNVKVNLVDHKDERDEKKKFKDEQWQRLCGIPSSNILSSL